MVIDWEETRDPNSWMWLLYMQVLNFSYEQDQKNLVFCSSKVVTIFFYFQLLVLLDACENDRFNHWNVWLQKCNRVQYK